MKSMKKIVSFLLTLSLLLSIAPFAFATDTTELTEVTYLPIALEYDSDLIVTEGQELDSNTFMGGEKARNFVNAGKYLGPALLGTFSLNVGTNDNGTPDDTSDDTPIIEDRECRVDNADLYNTAFNAFSAKTSSIESSLNKAFTDAGLAIAFDIPEGGEASKVNDTIIRYGLQEAKKIETSGRPSSKIYFAHAASNKADLEVIFEYTDGTFSDIKTLESANYAAFDDLSTCFTRDGYLKNNQSAYKMADDGTAQKIHRYVAEKKYPLADGSGEQVAVKKNEDGSIPTEPYNALQTFVGISSIDVDANKVVKNIYIGSIFDAAVAIYAATEATLTNEELVAATTKTATDDELRYARACVDELVNYRGASAADYEDIITASNNKNFNLKNAPVYYLDLPADSDSIAADGDDLDPATWSTMRKTGGGLNAKKPYIYLPGTVKAVDGTPVKIIVAESGEPDSIARPASKNATRDCEKEEKLVLSKGRPASKLNIAYVANADNKNKLSWTIKYTDGTIESVEVRHPGLTYVKDATDPTMYATYSFGGKGISLTNNKAELVTDSTKNASIVVTSIDLAPGKIVESYTISAMPTNNVVIVGLSETPLTNDELIAATKFDEFGIAYAEDDEIKYAKVCVDELVNNRGASAADYEDIIAEYNNRGFFADEVKSLPITLPYDSDLIVQKDDVLDSDTFMGGEEARNYIYGDLPLAPALSGETYEVIVKTETDDNGTPDDPSDDVVTETKETRPGIALSANKNFGAFSDTGIQDTINSITNLKNNGIEFILPADVEKGGVNDTIIRYGTQDEIIVEVQERPQEVIYFAHRANGAASLPITFEYTDGTFSETKQLKSQVYDNITGIPDYVGRKTFATNSYKMNAAGKAEQILKYKTETLKLASDGTTDQSVAIPDGNGDYVTEAWRSTTNFVAVSSVPVDENKVVKNIIIGSPKETLVVLYGATAGLVRNSDLSKAVNIDLSQASYDEIMYAKACADELVRRGADASDFNDVNAAFNEAQYTKPVHLNISESLNTDVIIPYGEVIANELFEGSRDKKLYNSSLIPAGGLVKMTGRATDKTFTKPDGTVLSSGYFGRVLSDATFQLAEGYKGYGKDAVLVAKEEGGVKIQLSKEEQKPYGKMYFLLETPDGAKDIEMPYVEPYTVNVKIEYADGTFVEAETYLHDNAPYFQADSEKYAPGSFFANNKMNYGMLDLYEDTNEAGEDVLRADYGINDKGNVSAYAYDQARFTASTLNPISKEEVDENVYEYTYPELYYKNVKSVTFMPSTAIDYTVLAVTGVPFNATELYAKWENAAIKYDEEGIIVEGEDANDIEIEEGAKALIELYEVRGFVDYALDAEMAQLILEEINDARQLIDTGFETQLSFVKADGKIKATALVTNGNIPNKEIVLIIAVYGQNNKLLDIQASPLTSFSIGTNGELLETPTCDDHAGEAVSYSAFVWESLDSMRPISYITQPAQ